MWKKSDLSTVAEESRSQVPPARHAAFHAGGASEFATRRAPGHLHPNIRWRRIQNIQMRANIGGTDPQRPHDDSQRLFSYNPIVTEILKKAFDRISTELPDYAQDELGRHLLSLIEQDEAQWQTVLAKSPDKLRKLADRALEAYRDGRTTPLDIEKL